MTKLKELIEQYGIDKINTLTKYPSILTLHALDNKGKLTDELTSDVTADDCFTASEKVDGTNFRIICWDDEYLIGSRKELLTYSGDMCRNDALSIVDEVRKSIIIPSDLTKLTVIYGEMFGGKIGQAAKQYGTKSEYDYRIFDIVEITDLSILDKNLIEISHFRESTKGVGLQYGHEYLSNNDLKQFCDINALKVVPPLPVSLVSFSRQDVFDYLNKTLPKTLVAISDSGLKKPEGVILRNYDRSKIVKLRFDDYRRSLR